MSSLLNNPEIDKLIIMALAGMVAVLTIALIIVSIKKNTYYVDENGDEILTDAKPVVKKKKKSLLFEEVEEDDEEEEEKPAVTPAAPVETPVSTPAPVTEEKAVDILNEMPKKTDITQVDVTVVINGHASEKTVTTFPCPVGRESDNKLVVNEAAVSRKHARLITDNGNLYIEDISEHNGTYINRTKLPSLGRALLHEGDVITLGRAEVKIEHII